jgi:hypothetical protein
MNLVRELFIAVRIHGIHLRDDDADRLCFSLQNAFRYAIC